MDFRKPQSRSNLLLDDTTSGGIVFEDGDGEPEAEAAKKSKVGTNQSSEGDSSGSQVAGDQIGRVLACWATDNFGQLFENYPSSSNFQLLFPTVYGSVRPVCEDF
jgi:hypothetical protein